jgi:hypothetical protein
MIATFRAERASDLSEDMGPSTLEVSTEPVLKSACTLHADPRMLGA